MTGGRILVVEDEPLLRFALCDDLTEAGYEVVEAFDALSAIAAFGAASKIDAVISDVDMPGPLNGLDFVNLVAKTDQKIVIIVTSGRKRDECKSMPVSAYYLPKPYDYSGLCGLLSELLPVQAIAKARKA